MVWDFSAPVEPFWVILSLASLALLLSETPFWMDLIFFLPPGDIFTALIFKENLEFWDSTLGIFLLDEEANASLLVTDDFISALLFMECLMVSEAFLLASVAFLCKLKVFLLEAETFLLLEVDATPELGVPLLEPETFFLEDIFITLTGARFPLTRMDGVRGFDFNAVTLSVILFVGLFFFASILFGVFRVFLLIAEEEDFFDFLNLGTQRKWYH